MKALYDGLMSIYVIYTHVYGVIEGNKILGVPPCTP